MTAVRGPVLIDLEGLTVSRREAHRLDHPLVAGVILFARNYDSPGQLRALIGELRRIRPSLLVAVDQEGGRVQRFRAGLTRLPAAAGIGAVHDRDPQQARRLAVAAGWVMAGELRELDVDLSFAPVLDVSAADSAVIGDRSFHRDAAVVAELGECFVTGMARAGMAAVGKHFPGHGGVSGDSHLELPHDHRAMDALLASDLVPYRRLLSGRLAGVMTAHVVYDRIDPAPPTFSRHWLGAVLRERLGFRGAVFSDDLAMAGAAWAGAPAERGRRALDAGCDLLLLCGNPDDSEALLAGLRFRPDPGWRRRVAALRPAPAPREVDSLALAAAREEIGGLAAA